ncbi:MAG: cyclic nucleotide-binding domain-containing protein [Pyrinomonadaceae bacterium]
MPRVINNHEQIVQAFERVEIVSELVDKLPNGEFRHELEMDIILFGRGYRGHKVGPYVRLLEYLPGETIVEEGTWESNIFYVLVDGRLAASKRTDGGDPLVLGEVKQGNSFGEMAMLAGARRSATISVTGDRPALVLELARPALRLLRKLPKFARAIDRSYREYGAALTISELRDFAGGRLDADVLGRLADASRFVTYEDDHVLFRHGDPVNRVLYLRRGWIQRVAGTDLDPKAAASLLETESGAALDFVGAGNCLGVEAAEAPSARWPFSAVVRGRAEVFEIAVSRLREDEALRRGVLPVLREASVRDDAPKAEAASAALKAANREIETDVVDGANLLVMDMAKCVRCGNCSYACHQVHGHSRLVRRGIHIERPVRPGRSSLQNVLVPTVCMHCHDPECLTGCPTGAIARRPDGHIDIDPKTCIGCGDCATQCPYNAISMIGRGDADDAGREVSFGGRLRSIFALSPAVPPPPVATTDDLLAIKCDLCRGTPLNPPGAKRAAYSCEENCPTGALVRVNPLEYFDEISRTVGVVKKGQTVALGTNIHRRDRLATAWHVLGLAAVVLTGGLALWATMRFGQDSALIAGSWLTMRWATGLGGLAGIAWVMAYPWRKQIYRRRAGALRYWMLSHVYIGVAAGVVLLVHGGGDAGGLLTTLLMISFDLVIASGLVGAAVYLAVPRLMTRIEREPLLIEDLEQRQSELRADLARIARGATDPELPRLIDGPLSRRFLGIGYLLRQYIKREDLNVMLAEARLEFRPLAEGMSRAGEARLMEAVEAAATLRRVDALCYLHRMLKVWIAPHVLFTALMLVLMVVHIVQAVYFNVR